MNTSLIPLRLPAAAFQATLRSRFKGNARNESDPRPPEIQAKNDKPAKN